MSTNKAVWPIHIERNLMVFEMTLDGFTDEEICGAMKVNVWNLSLIRKQIFKKMMEPARIGAKAPSGVGHLRSSLRKHANFWHGRLLAMKVELNLIADKHILAGK